MAASKTAVSVNGSGAAAKAKEALAARKRETSPAPQSGPAQSTSTAPVQGPAPAAVPGTATLRLVFDSPINSGHVMVAVNDQILLRKPFSFKKSDSHSVLASMTVPSGQAAIKAWLSGPDMPSSFTSTTAQFSGGDSKTLRLELSGGKLTARVQ